MIHTMRKPLIVLAGPTASGKTALAIELAKRIDAEIISADSRQFYKGMDIGTAKPTLKELAEVPHHCINICELDEHISAGDFERMAIQLYEEISQRNKRVILTGGSGLYLQAVISGLDTFPDIPQVVKNQVEAIYINNGIAGLQEALANLDPQCFAQIDQQNPARLRRALEVSLAAGRPYSSFLEQGRAVRPFEMLQLLLEPERPVLYQRINERVDQMVAAGLEAEVERLLPYRQLAVMQTIGYQEWFPFFDGIATRAEVIDKIKQHTRNYAKRQGTWFRKYGNWTRIDGDVDSALGLIAIEQV